MKKHLNLIIPETVHETTYVLSIVSYVMFYRNQSSGNGIKFLKRLYFGVSWRKQISKFSKMP
jgi:hypothetical protein